MLISVQLIKQGVRLFVVWGQNGLEFMICLPSLQKCDFLFVCFDWGGGVLPQTQSNTPISASQGLELQACTWPEGVFSNELTIFLLALAFC